MNQRESPGAALSGGRDLETQSSFTALCGWITVTALQEIKQDKNNLQLF